jgi:retron-type reverse transcriptase
MDETSIKREVRDWRWRCQLPAEVPVCWVPSPFGTDAGELFHSLKIADALAEVRSGIAPAFGTKNRRTIEKSVYSTASEYYRQRIIYKHTLRQMDLCRNWKLDYPVPWFFFWNDHRICHQDCFGVYLLPGMTVAVRSPVRIVSDKYAVYRVEFSDDTYLGFTPELSGDLAQLADELGWMPERIRWLNRFIRKPADCCYKEKTIRTKNKTRTFFMPIYWLKAAQRDVLSWMYKKFQDRLSPACHGFRPGYSIVTNAAPHTGQKLVLGMDVKDFFPTITARRVFGLFRELGESKEGASFLTALTCHKNELPQGAPTSPFIANLLCRNLDKRLSGLAEKIGAQYTRYADDLTFSGGAQVRRLAAIVPSILKEEGFQANEKKTRICGQHNSQQVTGLTVNAEVNPTRKLRRLLRAMQHHATNGRTVTVPVVCSSHGSRHYSQSANACKAYMKGLETFVSMVGKRR